MGIPQNIYDDEKFFQGYRELRAKKTNNKILIEQPAMLKILPDMKNKKILEIGCGYGHDCKRFVELGAAQVLGTDVSEKMLEVAKEESSHEKIEYKKLEMEKINLIEGKFDLVYSALAFHYVKNFKKLIEDIYNLLEEDGELLFSQEHPLTTAPKAGEVWINDGNEKAIGYILTDYMDNGFREITWVVDGVQKYHRTFSEILMTLIESGFVLETMVEPLPIEEGAKLNPLMEREHHKPRFIIIKARKIKK